MTEAVFDLVSFGETMIRLATVEGQRLETSTELAVSIGGTESNVCVALSRLGLSTAWISALPESALGRKIAGELRRHGVDVGHVVWRDDVRAGLYFMETGAQPRPTRVMYDRAGSAVATLDPNDLDTSIVARASALHLTGITPALSGTCAEICRRLLHAAASAGVAVVVDVNYRSLLWTPEEAASGIAPLLESADLLFCGASDAATIWGITGDPEEIGQALLDRSGANLAVVTLGADGACAVRRDGGCWLQGSLPVEIIDPVGAGDAFAAGFLHEWLGDPEDVHAALRSGVALAALSMTMPGDLAIITPDELAAMLSQVEGGSPDIVR